MRIRRNIPQKPLTEEQKARALEAQKRASVIQGPLTQAQMYQSQQSPISSTGSRYPFNTMDRSFMMNKKMTFEEKYGVYADNQQQQGTKVEITEQPVIDQEDLIVPPSLEEDANQASPLPPGVENASEADNLDAYIKQVEDMKESEEERAVVDDIIENKELDHTTMQILEDSLSELSIKGLKDEYVKRGGKRDISHNNNKKNLINLILELVVNGSQKEETGGATTR